MVKDSFQLNRQKYAFNKDSILDTLPCGDFMIVNVVKINEGGEFFKHF